MTANGIHNGNGTPPMRPDRVRTWPLPSERLSAAKRAFVTRRMPEASLRTLIAGTLAPQAGDLVLARIERLRQHQRIETIHGRRAYLHVGDEIVVAYGNRYAPDQFEALVPERLGPTHLVAAGGLAAEMTARNERVKPATEITSIGLIGDAQGRRQNLRSVALASPSRASTRPPTLAVVGASMNAGKTTMAACVVRGLARAGMRVGAIKVTGTGSGGDLWQFVDAGAARVLDFTDAGHASTYGLTPEETSAVAARLLGGVSDMDVIVVEVADGLLQDETANLLGSPTFTRSIDGFLFAAGDALSACGGVSWMQERGLPVRAMGGLLTRSPLAVREASRGTRVPILSRQELSCPERALRLASRATDAREALVG